MIKKLSYGLLTLALMVFLFSIINFVVADTGFPTIDRIYVVLELLYMSIVSLILVAISSLLLIYEFLNSRSNKKRRSNN